MGLEYFAQTLIAYHTKQNTHCSLWFIVHSILVNQVNMFLLLCGKKKITLFNKKTNWSDP